MIRELLDQLLTLYNFFSVTSENHFPSQAFDFHTRNNVVNFPKDSFGNSEETFTNWPRASVLQTKKYKDRKTPSSYNCFSMGIVIKCY